jgi:putative endonuclease
MFHLYILFSASLQKFYIGHVIDPWVRLTLHNSDTSDKFTGKTSDWEMKAVFEVSENKKEAMELETFIKKQKNKKLLLKLIDPSFVPADKLSKLKRLPLEWD